MIEPALFAELRERFAEEAAAHPEGEVIAEMARAVQAGQLTWREAARIDGYADPLYVICAQVAGDPNALSARARAEYESAADELLASYEAERPATITPDRFWIGR